MERPRPCRECGSPLAEDQRYCLSCGARVGSRSPLLEPMLARVRGAAPPPGAPRARTDVAPAACAAVPASAASRRRLPSLRVSALLVLVFLGFGVLMGDAAKSTVSDVPVSARGPVRVVLAAPTSTSATSPEASSTAAGGEAASSEPEAPVEPTPAPAPTT